MAYDLTQRDAVPLAHALCGYVARDLGIRALSVKGPVAEHYHLREPRTAADADILVEPEQFDVYCQELTQRGWFERVDRDTPSLMELHTRTFIHEGWPCDIDVHHYFPGFLADKQEVFDTLWRDHTVMTIAAQDVRIPSFAGMAVITALHSLRYTQSEAHRDEFDKVVQAVRNREDSTELSRILDIARASGSQWTLAPFLESLGIDEGVVDGTPEQRRIWELNRQTIEAGATRSWIEAIKQARGLDKMTLLWRAIWVPRQEIPRIHEDQLPSFGEASRYRLDRWWRGMRTVVRQRGAGKSTGKGQADA